METAADKNIPIPLIRNKMIELMNIYHPNEIKTNSFQASRGWMRRFLDRFDLVRRRITSSGRGCPKDSVELIKEYLGQAYSFAQQFSLDSIINFDQTSFLMEMFGNYTIRKKGLNLFLFFFNLCLTANCILPKTRPLYGKKARTVPSQTQSLSLLILTANGTMKSC